MRAPAVLLLAAALSFSPARAETPEEQYHEIDAKFRAAEALMRAGHLQEALIEFDDCAVQLEELKRLRPPWQLGLVINRLDDCHTRELLVRFHLGEQGDSFGSYPPRFVGAQPMATAPSATTSAPLPPATLPVVAQPAPASGLPAAHFAFHDYPASPPARAYPWKSTIVTTVFWIGNASTAHDWHSHWAQENGGIDGRYDLSGYASGSHASTVNPFYVALPFNDLTHPELADRWLPRGWLKPVRDKNGVSACEGRWIEIKNKAGRICYAQWEDVGPINTDDAAYVFGPNRPAASGGLDVSPAVAKYLGIDSTAITSWRFVDDDDVQPGMWLRYDEQAVLFSALRAQTDATKGGAATTANR